MRQYRGRHNHHFGAIGFDDLAKYAALNMLAPSRSFYWGNHTNPIYWNHPDIFLIPTPTGYMQMGRNDMLISGLNGGLYPMPMGHFNYHFEHQSD